MTDNKPKSSTDRVAKLRARRKSRGHIRREYYATPNEHESLARFLRCMREKSHD
jgi:hypothetical protein